ncbi:MAG: hypothetical protein OXR73_37085 [Myxococcales bacterium]|nr:hypothetical protein [Myxococcales bacterium]
MATRWVPACGAALAACLAGCGGGGKVTLDSKTGLDASAQAAGKRPAPLGEETAADKGAGGARCDASPSDREAIQYDTSGDTVADVRKVFLRLGIGDAARLVMICRESDLNGDGKKDVIRYYDDNGKSLREDSDRNFDDRIDMSTIYQDGKIVRKELDDNHDGKVDAKIYYDGGKPVRAERDLAGRSTPEAWRPDRWEYFEDGQLVRMGTDYDGDNRVDRWDKDSIFEAAAKAREEAAAGGADAEEEAEPANEGEEG